MDHFSISEIEMLSGIKAHTLRIWEQRYGILTPKRKNSKHRYYDNEDLKQILRIAELNRTGYKISKIASMTDEQMRILSISTQHSETAYESFILQLADACMNFDEEQFNRIYHTMVLHTGVTKAVTNVFFPLLERVGVYWMNDQTRPVQEHFISNLIACKLLLAIASIELPRSGPVTILFNPEGEQHEIPLLFLHYLLKKRGKRVLFFGTNTKIETIQEYALDKKVDAVHMHLITNFANKEPNELVTHLLAAFEKQTIILSGPLSKEVTIANKRLQLMKSLRELIHYCNEEPAKQVRH
jgi:MerR family transcriptional regulator, light-induced transcriptional regulator